MHDALSMDDNMVYGEMISKNISELYKRTCRVFMTTCQIGIMFDLLGGSGYVGSLLFSVNCSGPMHAGKA